MANQAPPGPDYAEQKAEILPRPVSANTAVDTVRLWVSPSIVLSKEHVMGDVDPVKATFPLAAYCFMTGFMYEIGPPSSVPLILTRSFVRAFQRFHSLQCNLCVARFPNWKLSAGSLCNLCDIIVLTPLVPSSSLWPLHASSKAPQGIVTPPSTSPTSKHSLLF